MKNFEGIKHFQPGEFDHPEKMSPKLLRMLDEARTLAGVPFKITSGHRDASSTDTGAHTTGEGVDIRCHDSTSRFLILKGLFLAGFIRIGIYDRHIHADVSESLPRPVSWVGTSH